MTLAYPKYYQGKHNQLGNENSKTIHEQSDIKFGNAILYSDRRKRINRHGYLYIR